ncbi:MAG: hypothetical protein LBI53_03145 [Candidatus Peribacteria bacterium]|nr:hypothetical protein [Candidatus Peribacteria bacterium]
MGDEKEKIMEIEIEEKEEIMVDLQKHKPEEMKEDDMDLKTEMIEEMIEKVDIKRKNVLIEEDRKVYLTCI